MPPRAEKRRLFSRIVSVFTSRGRESAADRHRIASAGAVSGPSHSVPNLPLAVDNSIPEFRESPPQNLQSNSGNNIGESLRYAETPQGSNQDLYRPPPSCPVQEPCDGSVAAGSGSAYFGTAVYGGGGTKDGSTDAAVRHQGPREMASTGAELPQPELNHPSTHSVPELLLPVYNPTPACLESRSQICQSRSENNVVESIGKECPAVPMTGNRLPRPQLSPAQQRFDNPSVAPEPRAVYGGMSFLAGASEFRVGDINVYNNSDGLLDGWETLMKNIAPNALHDSSARYDAPKCDEDTRIEVTGEIMDRIQDRGAPQRLICMTGAAGAGKSALQQTIAERCTKGGFLGAAFFFSSTDPTRNTTTTVVGTIAYQLGLKHPRLQRAIVAAVKHDPLIFSKSVQSQMDGLIILPFQILRSIEAIDVDTFPYAILIDGLDECKGEDRQAELLTAIRRCILVSNLPFHVFIASRPEWAIRTALEPGGHLHGEAYHIQLSDKYDASGDMYRYLERRFNDIGLRIEDPEWYTEDNIRTLVDAASGQFVYVATAYNYISERRASPPERLKTVLTWTPNDIQTAHPFEALDMLYTNILLVAKKAYEAVDTHRGRDFLLLFRAHHLNVTGFGFGSNSLLVRPPANLLSALLCLGSRAEESLISDLHSLVDLKKDKDGKLRLHLYHKSFSDFLEAEGRAKTLFVSESRVETHLAKCFMQLILECPLKSESLPAKWEELPLPKRYKHSLREAVEDLPFALDRAVAIDEDILHFSRNDGWQKVNDLLPPLYCLKGWFFDRSNDWMVRLDQFTVKFKVQNPDAAAAISAFVAKWDLEKEGWGRERP